MTEAKAPHAAATEANPEEAIAVTIELIDAAFALVDEYGGKQIDDVPDACRTFSDIPEFKRLGQVLEKVAAVFQEEPAHEGA